MILPAIDIYADIKRYPLIDGIYYILQKNPYTGNQAYVAPEYYIMDKGTAYSFGHYSGNLVIPECVEYDGITYEVVGISSGALNGCSINMLVVPETIKRIAYDLSGDESYNYNVMEFSIERLCISSWKWWNELVIEGTDRGAYQNILSFAKHVIVNGEVYDMEDFKIPNEITHIRPYAFFKCSQIKRLTIPDYVKSIEASAFCGCEALEAIVIPDNVEQIGKNCFASCRSAKTLTMGDGLTVIPAGAFYDCGLEHITLGRNIKKMERDCFDSSSGRQTSVVITNLAAWCENFSSDSFSYKNTRFFFDNGTEITDLIVPEEVNSIHERCFSRIESLKSVKLPNTVESIGKEAFRGCNKLQKVTMGDGIKSIGDYAFGPYIKTDFYGKEVTDGNSELQEIILGKALETIGEQAFNHCDALKKIVARNEEPWPFKEDAFPTMVYRNADLFIPNECKELYSRLDGWRNFLKIYEQEGTGVAIVDAGEPLQLKTMLGGIIINTSKVGLLCKIYTLDGVLKYDSVLTKGDQRLSLPSAQTYIVKAGKQNLKVFVE